MRSQRAQTRLEKNQACGVQSEEREFTIRFTNIAEFTYMCESVNAKEIAAFGNHHLTLLAECIMEEGGAPTSIWATRSWHFWAHSTPRFTVTATRVGVSRPGSDMAVAMLQSG